MLNFLFSLIPLSTDWLDLNNQSNVKSPEEIAKEEEDKKIADAKKKKRRKNIVIGVVVVAVIVTAIVGYKKGWFGAKA